MKKSSFINVKTLSYTSLLIALSIILGMFTFFRLPQGGSITPFKLLPMILVAYFYGSQVGIIAGIALGLIHFIIHPSSIVHPLQFLLDYPIAYAVLGLGGFNFIRKKGLILTYIVGVFFKFLVAVISGYVFFASYTPEGFNPLIYSIYYNFSYIGPEAIITVVLLSIKPIYNKIMLLKNYI